MSMFGKNKEARAYWLFLLGLQGLMLLIGIVFAVTLRTSTPSVESKLTDQNTCMAEAQKAEAVGSKVPGELLARCQYLERRASTLQVISDKLSGTIRTGFLVAMALLALFIGIEVAILKKLN
jgi:predicted membrane protein